MKPLKYLAGTLFLLALSGCNQPSTEIETVSYRRFDNVDMKTIYEAAHATMSEFFRIERADSGSGLIRSIPTAVPASFEGCPLGKPLSSPRQERKIAEIRLEQQDGGVIVRCGVLVQRAEPTTSLAYSSQRTIDDLPNKTPLQETEGRTVQGNLAWSNTGYDHKLERQLLAAIDERQAAKPSQR